MTTSIEKRIQQLEATSRNRKYVHVPSPGDALAPYLEAMRDGRPYSSLPDDHPARALRPPPSPPRAEPVDLTSPGALLLRQLENLRKALAGSDDLPDFEAIRRETVREILREQRDSARRERQRLKRQRRAERRRENAAAAMQATDSTT